MVRTLVIVVVIIVVVLVLQVLYKPLAGHGILSDGPGHFRLSPDHLPQGSPSTRAGFLTVLYGDAMQRSWIV